MTKKLKKTFLQEQKPEKETFSPLRNYQLDFVLQHFANCQVLEPKLLIVYA